MGYTSVVCGPHFNILFNIKTNSIPTTERKHAMSKTLYVTDHLVTADGKRDFYEIQCDPVDSRPTERTAFILAYARSKAETRINSLTRAKRESRRIILDNYSMSIKLLIDF